MFSHIVVGANDIEASKKFYDALISSLGGGPAMVDNGRLIYAHGGSMLLVTAPINGEPATHANGGTIGFNTDSAEQTDAWHAAGVANGGTSCEDAPGVREMGAMKLYLAYLRDPAGNKLCAMHRLTA